MSDKSDEIDGSGGNDGSDNDSARVWTDFDGDRLVSIVLHDLQGRSVAIVAKYEQVIILTRDTCFWCNHGHPRFLPN